MPVGIQRINARHQQPNSRITFIKPLPGPDAALAQDFLERIAAICHPIMKSHYLSVTTLEEYEPNPEFIGRNFNAGEIIQLVLKSRSGGWLPFRHVQMVMMHELAHNVQMNHSKFFWIERNKFSADIQQLWAKGYTGDGFWGHGKTTEEGRRVEANTVTLQDEQLPLSLCGGTYRTRRRGRKRKRGQTVLTWKEREEQRIARKFGNNGLPLGGDTGTRAFLENGKRPKGNPRVAGSNRGRELRAAAALARFGQQLQEQESKKEEEQESGSESEDDGEDAKTEARDINGQRLLDSQGQRLVRVCEGEDIDEAEVRNELEELAAAEEDFVRIKREQQVEDDRRSPPNPPTPDSLHTQPMMRATKREDVNMRDIPQYRSPEPEAQPKQIITVKPRSASKSKPVESGLKTLTLPHKSSVAPTQSNLDNSSTNPPPRQCKVCSMFNDRLSATCAACANVLDIRMVADHWRCQSDMCKESGYINAGDYGVCNVCGAVRESFQRSDQG